MQAFTEQQLGEAEHPKGRGLSLSSRIIQPPPPPDASISTSTKRRKVRPVRHLGTKEWSQVCYQGLCAPAPRPGVGCIAVATDGTPTATPEWALLAQINPRMLREELAGHAAIGHVRYSTNRLPSSATPSCFGAISWAPPSPTTAT
jgi:hypothetical protein